MYNSLMVRFLVRIWNIFSWGYENSRLKIVKDWFEKSIEFLFFGSKTKDIFLSDNSLIEKSLFYSLYSKLINLFNQLIKKMNNYIKSIGKNSLVYKNISNLFKDDFEVFRTILIFVFFFGIGIIMNNVIRNLFSGRSYLVAIGLIVFSIISMSLRDRYKAILENSIFYKFVIDIFTIDEGGANWW